MSYENKYNLTKRQSLFLGKRKMEDVVYCGMKMENRAVTFPQTKTILDGVNVSDVRLDDIQAILNMRGSWRFLMNTVDEPLTLDYLCKLNGFIARNEALEWGKLRTGKVSISGTDYMPPIPSYETVEQELSAILDDKSITETEKALNIFSWGARSQLFWDGNKRTSLTAANKILLQSGHGMLTVTDKYMERFNSLLVAYYNSGNPEELKRFMYDNTIKGIEM